MSAASRLPTIASELAHELLERAPWGIYVVDADFRIAYMNPNAQFGAFRNVRPVVGRLFDDAMRVLWPEAVAQEIVGTFRHTLETGEAFLSNDFVRPRSDVEAVEGYEWQLQQVDLPSGSKGVICYYYDSTLLRNTEAALRRSEIALREALERNVAISEATPDFVWVSDAHGRVEYVNENWTVYTGYTLERLNEQGWQGMHHPDEIPRLEREWTAALTARRSFEVEFRYRRHDGVWRWFLGRTVPILGSRGEVVRWVGITTDIHDRKLMEVELRAKARALQEADRQKNQFLATLAHELRNPMAPIRYATALLTPEASPQSIVKVRSILERQSAQMARLLDDLLDMSRVTHDVIELQMAPVELGQLVRQAVEAGAAEVAARNQALACRTPDEPVWVDGDAARLLQVIGNLMSNAAKYTPSGGRIEIDLSATQSHALLVVRDNGVGLSQDMLPRLFQMFTQFHRDLNVSSDGLGIGLAVARRLVELHGGTLQASSEGLKRGSEFLVRLALREAPARTNDASGPAVEANSRRILVVDDNQDAAHVLAELLALHGHECHVATNGKSAIGMSLTLRPDVVLLDIGLPDLDGVDVARRLRQEPGTADALLVALTGWGQEQDRERTSGAGFDLHLVKPVDPTAVLDAVQMGRARRGQESAR